MGKAMPYEMTKEDIEMAADEIRGCIRKGGLKVGPNVLAAVILTAHHRALAKRGVFVEGNAHPLDAPSPGAEAMTAPLPPLTDEQFEEYVAYFLKLTVGGSRTGDKFNAFIADDRWHRAELAKARAEGERLRTELRKTVHWIETDCQPRAEFAAQGHNWNTSADDRVRGCKILDEARAALAPEREGAG